MIIVNYLLASFKQKKKQNKLSGTSTNCNGNGKKKLFN